MIWYQDRSVEFEIIFNSIFILFFELILDHNMNNQKMNDQISTIRDEYKEKLHQMIKEARIEQLTNQKYKTNSLKMTSEDLKRYEQLRQKAKKLIEKAREDQLDDKSAKNGENNHIEEHALSNIDTSLFLPSSNKEKLLKSYRVRKVKDLPRLKKKLDSRLHDRWKAEDDDYEGSDNYMNSDSNKKSKSSPIKSYYANYELPDLQKELEIIDKEALNLRDKLRDAVDNNKDKKLQEHYTQKWYELINKRNAAIRREMQLHLIENEKKLNIRHEQVKKELQVLVSIEESQKTDAQYDKQKELEEELVEIVNKRSELLVRLDLEEQAIKDDVHEIDFDLPQSNDIDSLSQDYLDLKNCSLM